MRNFGTLVTVLSLVVGCSSEHGGHGSEPSDPTGTPSDAELVPAVIDTPSWKGPFAPAALANESNEAGVVQVTLEAVEADVDVVAGETVKLWTYNGVLPGPRIEARVGDLIRVHFKNALREATTIHWHGLRVPAEMDGAPAAQTPIEPGGEFTYEFVAVDAGTFWYHPHVRSDEQVERGLYGSIVVRDDAEPHTSSEATVLLDDVLLDQDFQLASFSERHAMVGRQGNVILVNGHARPVAELAPGGLHRMRFVNAANARYFRLSLGEDFWVLGFDGAKLERPVRVSESLLVPGARVDVAFAGKAAGERLAWRTLSYERGHETGTSPDAKLFDVTFAGESNDQVSLPEAFAELPLLAEATATKLLALEESTGAGGPHAGHGGGGDAAPVFSINGEIFPNVQPLSAVLGTTEEWTVTNTTEMDHPFHLHGFRFEVTDVDGARPPFRALQDTINIGAMQTVTLRVPLDGHPGAWMFHCHILEHAERGMMGELDVIRP